MATRKNRPKPELVALQSIADSMKAIAESYASVAKSLDVWCTAEQSRARSQPTGRQPRITSISRATYDKPEIAFQETQEEVPGFRRR